MAFNPNTYFADKQANVARASDEKAARLANKAADREEQLRKDNEANFLAASFGASTGGMVEGVGNVYGAITGDVENAATQLGQDTAAYWENRKPQELTDRWSEHHQEVAAQEGEWAKFGKQITGIASDPMLLSSFFAEQIPQTVGPGAVGKAASIVGAGSKLAQGIAIGTGSGLHSAESFKDTYDRILNDTDQEQLNNHIPYLEQIASGVPEKEARHQIALGEAREAMAVSFGFSLGTNLIPGPRMLEKALVGDKLGKSRIGNMAKAGVGETAQEITEEVTGKGASNYNVGDVDATQEFTEGFGEAAGGGALGGFGMGTATGLIAPTSQDPDTPQEEPPQDNVPPVTPPPVPPESEATGSAPDPAPDAPQDPPDNAEPTEAELAEESGDYPPGLETAVDKGQYEKLFDPENSPDTYSPDMAVAYMAGDIQNPDEPTTLTENMSLRERIGKAKDVAQATLANLQAQAGKKNIDKATKKALKDNIIQAKAQLDRIGKDIKVVDEFLAVPDTSTNASAQTAIDDTADEATRTQAVSSVISAMELNPNSVEPDLVDAMLSSSLISEANKGILETYSKANQARNAAKSAATVSSNVVEGDKGFKGLLAYRAKVRTAMANNKPEEAQAEVNSLTLFRDGQKAKLAAVQEARAKSREAVEGNKKQAAFYVYKDPESSNPGGWVVSPTKPWKSEAAGDAQSRQSMGGLTIFEKGKGAQDIVNNIQTDLAAIDSTLDEVTLISQGKADFRQSELDRKQKEANDKQAQEANTQVPEKKTPKPKAKAKPKAVAVVESKTTRETLNRLFSSIDSDIITTLNLQRVVFEFYKKNDDALDESVERVIESMHDIHGDFLSFKQALVLELKNNDSPLHDHLDELFEVLYETKKSDDEYDSLSEEEIDRQVEEGSKNRAAEKAKKAKDLENSTLEGEFTETTSDSTTEAKPGVGEESDTTISKEAVVRIKREKARIDEIASDPSQVENLFKGVNAIFQKISDGSLTAIEKEVYPALLEHLRPIIGNIERINSNNIAALNEKMTEINEEIQNQPKQYPSKTTKTISGKETVLEWIAKKGGIKSSSMGGELNSYHTQKDTQRPGGFLHGIPVFRTDKSNGAYTLSEMSDLLIADGWFTTTQALDGFATEENYLIELIREQLEATEDSQLMFNGNANTESADRGRLDYNFDALEKDLREQTQLQEILQTYRNENSELKSAYSFMEREDDGDISAQFDNNQEISLEELNNQEQAPLAEQEAGPEIAGSMFDILLNNANSFESPTEQKQREKETGFIIEKALAKTLSNVLIQIDADAQASGQAKTAKEYFSNHITLWWNQLVKSPGSGAGLPLVNEPDLFNRLVVDGELNFELINKYIKAKAGVDPETRMRQTLSFGALADLHQVLSAPLQQFVYQPASFDKDGNVQYGTQDYMKFFEDENGALNSAITEAITVAVFSWISRNGKKSYNTSDEVAAMARLPKGAEPTAEHYAAYGVGTRRSLIVNELGSEILKILGLTPIANAPSETRSKLETSFGNHALALMLIPTVQDGAVVQPLLEAFTTPTVDGQKLDALEANKEALVQLYAELDQDSTSDAEGADIRQQIYQINKANVKLSNQVNENFIRINREVTVNEGQEQRHDPENNPANPVITKITAVTTDTQGIIGSFFQSSTGQKAPNFEGGKFTGTTVDEKNQKRDASVKNTTASLPEGQGKVLEDMSKRPHRISTEITKNIGHMGIELSKKLAGIFEPKFVHVRRKASHQSKQEQKLSSFNGLVEFAKEALERDIFITPEAYKNGRVGNEETIGNMQNDKFARHLMHMEAWKNTFDITYAGGPNSEMSETEKVFLLSVSLGLDVAVDKNFDSDVLSDLEAVFAKDGKYHAVLEVFIKMADMAEGETITSAEAQIIESAVLEIGNEFAAVDAFTQMASYVAMKREFEEALTTMGVARNYPATFESRAFFEVDGTANGAALAQASMGVLGAQGPSFGLFNQQEANQFGSHVGWKKNSGESDIYEKLIAETFNQLETADSETVGMALAIFDILTNGKGAMDDVGVTGGGRNVVKELSTAVNYGAGLDRYVANLHTTITEGNGKYYDGWYQQLMDAANKHNGSKADINAVVDKLNLILNSENQVPSDMTAEQAMEFVLSKEQLENIRVSFVGSIQKPMQDGGAIIYKDYLLERDRTNLTANAVYERYKVAFNFLKERKEAELEAERTKAGWLPNPKFKQELSAKQIKEINDELGTMYPLVHSAFSLAENNLKAGVFLGKSTIEFAGEEKENYKQSNRPGKDKEGSPVASWTEVNQDNNGEATGNSKRTDITETGKTIFEQSPGVSTLPWMIMSLDSWNLHTTLEEFHAVGLHDAGAFGVHQAYDGARKLNEQAYKGLIQYSVPLEVNNALLRSVDGANALTEKYPELGRLLAEVGIRPSRIRDKVDGNERQIVHKRVRGKDPQTGEDSTVFKVDAQFIRLQTADALRNRLNSLIALKNVVLVDQYVMEGGAYNVTEADLAMVNEEIRAIVENLNALKELKKTSGKAPGTKAVAPKTNKQPTPEETGYDPTSGFANGDNISYENSKSLLGWFKKNKNPSVKELSAQLRQQVKASLASSRVKNFQKALILELEAKLQKSNTKIVYLDRATLASSALPENIRTSKKWSAVSATNPDGSVTVYVKGAEFQGESEQSVSLVTLLHEMVHGATDAAIIKYGEMTEAPSNAQEANEWAAVQELKALKLRADAYVKQNYPGNAAYRYAGKSLSEFVAIGMSDAAFQRDVLSALPPTPTKSVKITAPTNGWSEFAKSIFKIVFTGKGVKGYNSSFSTFLASTAILMETTSTIRAQQEAAMSTQMESEQATDPESETSSRKQDDQSQQGFSFSEIPPTSPMAYTTQQIFDALVANPNGKSMDSDWKAHLNKMLNTVVMVAYSNSSSIRANELRSTPTTADDVFIKATSEGLIPFASRLMQLKVSRPEAFTAQSIEMMFREGLKVPTFQASQISVQLKSMFSQAQKELSAKDFHKGDWDTATEAQKTEAENAYKLILMPSKGVKEGDYLTRFAAASIAYKPLHDAMQGLTVPATDSEYKGLTLLGKMFLLLSNMVNMFNRRTVNVKAGQQLTDAIQEMAQRMAQIEARKQAQLEADKNKNPGMVEKLAKVGSNVADGISKGLDNTLESKFVQNSKNTLISTARNIGETIKYDEGVGPALTHALDFFENAFNAGKSQRQNVFQSILREARSGKLSLKEVTKLHAAMHKHQNSVVSENSNTKRLVGDAFKSPLTDQQSERMTSVLNMDLSLLLERGFDMAEIERFISNTTATNSRIAVLEGLVKAAIPAGDFNNVIKKAKDLAHFNVTNVVLNDNLQTNVFNILHKAGTSKAGPNIGNAEALGNLDELVTLYTLNETDSNVRTTISQVMREEANRTDKVNGVELILRFHNDLKKQSRETEFKTNPWAIMKGYKPDILDSHVSHAMATKAEGEILIRAGYQLVNAEPVKTDSRVGLTGPQQPVYMYFIQDGGLTDTVKGGLSLKSRKPRGSTGANTFTELNKYVEVPYKGDATKYEPRKVKTTENYAVPVIGTRGQVVKTRFMMSQATKTSIYNQDLSLANVMGKMSSQAHDKAESSSLNKTAVDTLKVIYVAAQTEAKRTKKPLGKDWIYVSASSSDPVVQEAYKLLPLDTRKHIKKSWGQDGMYVKAEAYEIMFGYRKYSLREAAVKEAEARNLFEKAFVAVVANVPIYTNGKVRLIGEQAAYRIGQSEDVWQALVKTIKDNVVIKNVITLLGNDSSNASILFIAGVPPKDIISDRAIALRGTVDYLKDRGLKERVEKQLNMGLEYIQAEPDRVLNRNEAESLVVKLEQDLKNNPIEPLMREGMYQTLVEDIETEKDNNGYKSRMEKTIAKYTGANSEAPLVKGARAIGEQVFLTHDTDMYKFLNSSTMMSDFGARYVLYKHVTNRKIKPMEHGDAIDFARAAFVNYDIPTHKGVQYMNDMGIIWFSKYYIRMQAVLFQLGQDHPYRMFGLLAGDYFGLLGGIPVVSDSSMFTKNPLNIGEGAFGWLDSVDEIAPIALISQ